MVDVWGGTEVCLTIQIHWQGLSWHSMDQSKMSGDILFLIKNTSTYTCAIEVKVNPFSELTASTCLLFFLFKFTVQWDHRILFQDFLRQETEPKTGIGPQ